MGFTIGGTTRVNFFPIPLGEDTLEIRLSDDKVSLLSAGEDGVTETQGIDITAHLADPPFGDDA